MKNFEDRDAAAAACCERAFVRYLDGGCSSPVASHARVSGDHISLLGLYYDESTGTCRKGSLEGTVSEAETLGICLAKQLKEDGK